MSLQIIDNAHDVLSDFGYQMNEPLQVRKTVDLVNGVVRFEYPQLTLGSEEHSEALCIVAMASRSNRWSRFMHRIEVADKDVYLRIEMPVSIFEYRFNTRISTDAKPARKSKLADIHETTVSTLMAAYGNLTGPSFWPKPLW